MADVLLKLNAEYESTEIMLRYTDEDLFPESSGEDVVGNEYLPMARK